MKMIPSYYQGFIIISLSLLISQVHSFAPSLCNGRQKHGGKISTPPSSSHDYIRALRLMMSTRSNNNNNPSISGSIKNDNNINSRRLFVHQIIAASAASTLMPLPAQSQQDVVGMVDTTMASPRPFHSAAYGQEEYTNSIVASRDTNISPKEVYDTIASDFLTEALNEAIKAKQQGRTNSNDDDSGPRALDVGAGAGVSTEVLYKLGYHRIDALDWSGEAWNKYVTDDPRGHCPPGVHFYELDDERYLDKWRAAYPAKGGDDGLFDVIVFNFAVNENKAALFAKELLNKNHGRLLAPINTNQDYWLKQNYKVMNSNGDVLWSAVDVGAWSVQFQPDVTQDTVSERIRAHLVSQFFTILTKMHLQHVILLLKLCSAQEYGVPHSMAFKRKNDSVQYYSVFEFHCCYLIS